MWSNIGGKIIRPFKKDNGIKINPEKYIKFLGNTALEW